MPNYEEVGKEIGRLVTGKNIKHGNSFKKSEDLLRIFYPDGISLENYKNVLTITRILDKLSRISANNDSDGESHYQDIAGYCILACAEGK